MISGCIGCRHEPPPEAAYREVENRFTSGDLSEANKLSQKAYIRFESSRPDWGATFRLELAKVLLYQGKYPDVLELLQQPLPPNSQIELKVRQNILLSIVQARLGHRDQSEEALLEAERLCPDCRLRGEISGARGSVDMEKGNLDAAEQHFQASLAGARLNGDRFLETQALVNLGYAALGEEHYEDALARFNNASDLARSIGAKLALEKIVGNIGNIYFKTGDFPRSLDNYKEAERQAAELGALKDQILWLSDAGESEFQLGEFDAARSFYERSLNLVQATGNQNQILILEIDLGYLQLELNNPDAAAIHIHEATRLAALRKNNRAELHPMLLEARLLYARGNKSEAIRTFLDLDKRAAELPSVQWDAESNLARIYAETGRQVDADHWFRQSIDTFQRSRASLTSVDSTLPFLAKGNDLYAGYSEYLVHENRPEVALNVIDESRAESLADGLHLTRPQQKGQASRGLNARSIAAQQQATILVYSLQPKASYLWVITPARQQFFQIAGSETILPLVQQHSKMIMASRDLISQPDAPGRRLYDALVVPAQGLIKKNSRVFIVADDALSGLNFETLQTPGNDSHYWIEDVAITNAKSLQLLSMRAPRQPHYADRRILLMGDPVYRKDEYAELPNAATEVAKIASHFSSDRRTVLTGPQASPEAYQLAHAGEYSYVHFVAHATANMSSPLDSAVVLSRDHDDATVYKLYARDILKQNLNADLVTVSSCYGSGIRNYSGEGLVGLAWAFLRAGSHHVIGAMWDVSDISTPMLMDRLYGELAKGTEPDEALRTAKLAMIHSDGVFRKPLYWAPFQLYSGA